MPIRLRDSNAFVGRVRATTDVAASLAGTHVAPPSRAGAIAARLDELVPLFVGEFQPAPNRLGTIAVTLDNVTASEIGTSAAPPAPARTGTIAATLQGASAEISATSSAPAGAPTWWPNWPIMNATCVQGAGPAELPVDHAADMGLIIFQSNYQTTARCDARAVAMNGILAENPNVKFIEYRTPCVTYKVNPNTNSNEREFNRELIDDPVNGHPDWIVKRVDGTPCSTLFNPDTDYQTNITTVAPRNSLGEDYATAYWKKNFNAWTPEYRALLSGVFHDVFNQRPATLFNSAGTATITDADYDRDGVADGMTSFSANGGGTRWAAGGLNTKAKFEARFPGKFLIPNGARWDFDYFDGNGDPPLPLSTAPFYQQFEMALDESVHSGNLSLTATGTSYNSAGTAGSTGPFQRFFRAYHIFDKFLKADASVPSIGRAAYLFHAVGNNREPQANDIEFMRFISLSALQPGADRLWSLDELLLELGAPTASRSMGTLNESTLAFTIRTADQSVGVARFYWARFAKGIVVVRGDAPTIGTYPSADPAVTCTLPPPGTGKKWQRINSATYVNPITGRAMRGQNTALNSGADATTVALKPFHAMMLRLVNT
jgi:hypothetical protein